MSDFAHNLPSFEVELPGGGKLELQSLEEVELWEESAKRYLEDYQLIQQNDLVLVGAILSQQLVMFRAQQRLNGMVLDLDAPPGTYKRIQPKPTEQRDAQGTITKASTEIRELEKALGIDKKTREAGGTHTVANYVSTLKRAGRELGLHLSKRLTKYEEVCMEARWRLRVLRNGDTEDRQYHGITPANICTWLEEQLAEIEELDKEFAKTKAKLYLGRV